MSKYEIKELIDSAMYGTFNILSQVLFNINGDRKLVINNIKFKDLHKGQRCFILGTGPSLKNVDLSILKNEVIFGVNYFYKGNIPNDLNVNYYCLYDEVFYEKNFEDTKDLLKKLPKTIFFFRTKAYPKIAKLENIDNIYYQACNLFQHRDLIRTDLTKNVTAPFNVLLGCIQTAIYMGFREIYLLGSDFNSFASTKNVHFYDNHNDDSISRTISLAEELKYYSLVAYHHYALENYARNNDVKIYNVTENSLLDAYERKDLKTLFFT